ncbi:hypothetical protein GC174_10820 [bacterium]|nr:hypothetical protein [bacterium]
MNLESQYNSIGSDATTRTDAGAGDRFNLVDLMADSQKAITELKLVGEGAVGGIVDEFNRDPGKAACDAGLALASGAAIGVGIGVMAAEAPLIGAACVGGATLMGAQWLWSKVDLNNPSNIERNTMVKQAMDRVWQNHESPYAYEQSLAQFKQAVGPDELETATGLLAGVGAAAAGRCTPAAVSYLRQSPLKARIEFNMLGKDWVKAPDGSKILRSGNYEPLEVKAYGDGRRVVTELDTDISTTTFRDGRRVTEYPNGGKLTKTRDYEELDLGNGEKWIQRDGAREKHSVDGRVEIETLTGKQVVSPGKYVHRLDLARGENTIIDPAGNVKTTRSDGTILKYNLHDSAKRTIDYPNGDRTTWDGKQVSIKSRNGDTYIFGEVNSSRMWGGRFHGGK